MFHRTASGAGRRWDWRVAIPQPAFDGQSRRGSKQTTPRAGNLSRMAEQRLSERGWHKFKGADLPELSHAHEVQQLKGHTQHSRDPTADRVYRRYSISANRQSPAR